jgi:hypothetical protein
VTRASGIRKPALADRRPSATLTLRSGRGGTVALWLDEGSSPRFEPYCHAYTLAPILLKLR